MNEWPKGQQKTKLILVPTVKIVSVMLIVAARSAARAFPITSCTSSTQRPQRWFKSEFTEPSTITFFLATSQVRYIRFARGLQHNEKSESSNVESVQGSQPAASD